MGLMSEAGDPSSPGGGEARNAFDPMEDPMAPPREACECWCLHCRRTFQSSEMWFQRVIGARDGFTGFWMCPTHNCDGAGFGFDIFPTDPEHPANEGWTDTDEEDYADEEEFDEGSEVTAADAREWDPDEPQYKQLDEEIPDDDIAGEEWKYGLEPGAEPPEPPWARDARAQWEEDQKRYDAPDERPRELDWTNRPQRGSASGDAGDFNEDDIPF